MQQERDNDLARISRERELVLLKKTNDDKALSRRLDAVNRAELLSLQEAGRKKADLVAAFELAKQQAENDKAKLRDSIAAENRAVEVAEKQKEIADAQAKANRDAQVAALKILGGE